MIGTILLKLACIYIGCIVSWRLFIAIMMIFQGYKEKGFVGALGAAIINFLMNLWDLAKLAFFLIILIIIIRGCNS